MGLMLLITGADLSAREDFDLASLAVPDSVEADSGYNRLLQHYNYYCIKGDKFPEFDRDSLAALFRRPSFFSMTVNLMREEKELFSTHESISYSEYTFEYFEELVK